MIYFFSKHQTVILLCLIIFIGGILRLYKLGDIPSGFFADEASVGINAYNIVNTARDESGALMPMLFSSFGGSFFRPGIPIYVTSFFVAIFGLNEIAVRLPAAIFGILTVIFVFMFADVLFKKKLISLTSAFLIAISPWHIQFSRAILDFDLIVFFLVIGLYCFFRSISSKNNIFLIASFITFGLTLYTYVPAYFYVPLFVISLLLIYFKELRPVGTKPLLLSLLLFFLLTIPLIWGIPTGKTFSRYQSLAASNNKNTRTEILNTQFNTYVDHFSYSFLFKDGDIGFKNHFITRHSIKGMGELYLLQLPFLVLGILTAILIFKKKSLILYFWLLVYPLSSCLAPFADGGGPFANRSILGVIPMQIFTAIGIYALCTIVIKIEKLRLIVLLLIFFCFGFSLKGYIYKYFYEYKQYSSDFWGWQYGARDIVHYFVKNENQYDQLIMAPEFNAPEIFFKFYAPNDCKKCVVGLPDTNYKQSLKQLFAVTPNYLKNHPLYKFSIKKVIYYPNGSIAFKIGEIVQ